MQNTINNYCQSVGNIPFGKYGTILFVLLMFFRTAAEDNFASSGYSSGSMPFLQFPVTGRAASLSAAVTAWKDDFSGVQYNPAILDACDSVKYSGEASYTIMTLDRNLFGISGSASLGQYLVLGFSYSAHHVNGIEGRNNFGVPTSDFSYRDNAVAVSAAGRIIGGVSLGGTVRFLYSSLETENAKGLGVDLGALYSPVPFLTVGLSSQNILSYVWWTTGHRDQILPLARLGIRGEIFDGKIAAEADMVKPLHQPFDLYGGLEGCILDMIYMRGGVQTGIDIDRFDSRQPDFSLGTGMRFKHIGFDYAIVFPSSDLGLRHTVSIKGSIPVL